MAAEPAVGVGKLTNVIGVSVVVPSFDNVQLFTTNSRVICPIHLAAPGMEGEVKGLTEAIGEDAGVGVRPADERIVGSRRTVILADPQHLTLWDGQVLRISDVIVADGHVEVSVRPKLDTTVGVVAGVGRVGFGEVIDSGGRVNSLVVTIRKSRHDGSGGRRLFLNGLGEEDVQEVIAFEVRVNGKTREPPFEAGLNIDVAEWLREQGAGGSHDVNVAGVLLAVEEATIRSERQCDRAVSACHDFGFHAEGILILVAAAGHQQAKKRQPESRRDEFHGRKYSRDLDPGATRS